MTEVYKIIRGSTDYHEKLVYFWENIHNIRNFQIAANDNKNAMRYGLETVY